MKILYFLDYQKKSHRVARRAIVVGVLSAIAVIANALLDITPIYAIPIITAILAGIDKYIRK